MRLEYIVRPFQSFPVTPPQRIIDPTVEPAENLRLEIGREGDIKSTTASFSSSISGYTNDNHKEISRETEVKTITNPDDPSQHLEVENIKKLTTEKGTGINYKKSDYEFKNT